MPDEPPEDDSKMKGQIQVDENGNRNDEWSICLQEIGRTQCRASFERLFTHFAPLVKAFSMNGSAISIANAEELVQEVMIKVWQKASAYNPQKAAASTWIYTIARNSRTDMFRRLQKFDTPLNAEDIWEEDTGDAPFIAVQERRNAQQVKELLKTLPHEQAQILAKVYMEGKSHSEVAQELDIPLGTVKSRVRLAMQKLQIQVEK